MSSATYTPDHGCPARVTEFAAQTVEYVRAALGFTLEYDSDTLPVLDHYLRSVPGEKPATLALVATTSGAYFGEVVRRRLGGTWDMSAEDPEAWRVVLPGGLSFVPAGVVAAAVLKDEDDLDCGFHAPPLMLPHIEAALARMGEVSEEMYYSLCCRLDTLEHLQDVLMAIAASEARKRGEAN